MPEFAARLADFLESIASKARALSVDRANRAIVIAGLGLPIVVLVSIAVVFVFMTLHGALAVPLGDAAAFGILAGLFGLAGALVWSKRNKERS
jgi:hypothetical protein